MTFQSLKCKTSIVAYHLSSPPSYIYTRSRIINRLHMFGYCNCHTWCAENAAADGVLAAWARTIPPSGMFVQYNISMILAPITTKKRIHIIPTHRSPNQSKASTWNRINDDETNSYTHHHTHIYSSHIYIKQVSSICREHQRGRHPMCDMVAYYHPYWFVLFCWFYINIFPIDSVSIAAIRKSFCSVIYSARSPNERTVIMFSMCLRLEIEVWLWGNDDDEKRIVESNLRTIWMVIDLHFICYCEWIYWSMMRGGRNIKLNGNI